MLPCPDTRSIMPQLTGHWTQARDIHLSCTSRSRYTGGSVSDLNLWQKMMTDSNASKGNFDWKKWPIYWPWNTIGGQFFQSKLPLWPVFGRVKKNKRRRQGIGIPSSWPNLSVVLTLYLVHATHYKYQILLLQTMLCSYKRPLVWSAGKICRTGSPGDTLSLSSAEICQECGLWHSKM